jgi:GMP synthase (glutamine-hydrolysing)
MSKTALAIRHVAFEDLGIFGPMLAERGYAVRYLDAGVDVLDVDTLTQPDLVVVLGGPIGVYDTDSYPFLVAEREAIAARLRQYKPTVGICLGAQLMARALGAEVASTGRAEIGYAPLTLTEEGRSSVLAGLGSIPVLHWHGDQFNIPNGASRLAETPGFPNQAFAIGPHILGLQFHLEADDQQIERWLIGHAHELWTRGIDPRTIRRDAAKYGPELAAAARGVLATWLGQLG